MPTRVGDSPMFGLRACDDVFGWHTLPDTIDP